MSKTQTEPSKWGSGRRPSHWLVPVVDEMVPGQLARREHGEELVRGQEVGVRLERRRDFVGFREVHVEALCAKLMAAP